MAVQSLDTIAFDDAILSLKEAIAAFKDAKDTISSKAESLFCCDAAKS
jgi:hypothetical protein